jgi:hypothetical protein
MCEHKDGCGEPPKVEIINQYTCKIFHDGKVYGQYAGDIVCMKADGKEWVLDRKTYNYKMDGSLKRTLFLLTGLKAAQRDKLEKADLS